jgi:Outer membrane lipoprotein carrier protein LolA-like
MRMDPSLLSSRLAASRSGERHVAPWGRCGRWIAVALTSTLMAALGLGALPGASSPAFAQTGFGIAQLTQLLASVRAGEARFTERRHVAVLDQPLDSSGRLSFEAPDTFVRETLQPRRERVAVVGNQLTLTQGGRTRSVALDASPEAAVMVEAIRATLTGNRDALERHFKASVGGDARQWSLELVPRDARLRTQVNSIRLVGFQSDVREVVVQLADGDRSVMSIEPLQRGLPSPANPSSAATPPAAARPVAAPGGAGAASAPPGARP